MKDNDEFHTGDFVQLRGKGDHVGEIVQLTSRHATVAFMSMALKVPLQWLERAHVQHKKSSIGTSANVSYLPEDAVTVFVPTIDLHGLSVESARRTLSKWIDQATLLGHTPLKIIHGKGTGTLRSAVRAYLKSHHQVKNIIKQPTDPGGDGVTWVEIY